MYAGLGCLFILIFGFLFFVVAAVRTLLSPFFNMFWGNKDRKNSSSRPSGSFGGGFGSPFGSSPGSASQEGGTGYTHAGNARHSGNSRQRRKIFAREEGEYVEYEDVN